MEVINVQKLSSNAKIPAKGTSGAAGFDLYAAQSKVIPPRGWERVFLDIKVNILKKLLLIARLIRPKQLCQLL